MNKAERFFQLVTLLRSRRTAMTAGAIARMMGISVRTVYRMCRRSPFPASRSRESRGRLSDPARPPSAAADVQPDELQALIVGNRGSRLCVAQQQAQRSHGRQRKTVTLVETLPCFVVQVGQQGDPFAPLQAGKPDSLCEQCGAGTAARASGCTTISSSNATR